MANTGEHARAPLLIIVAKQFLPTAISKETTGRDIMVYRPSASGTSFPRLVVWLVTDRVVQNTGTNFEFQNLFSPNLLQTNSEVLKTNYAEIVLK